MDNKNLTEKAKQIRADIVKMLYTSQSGHPGVSLSCVEILMTIYYKTAKSDPKNPQWEDSCLLYTSGQIRTVAIMVAGALSGLGGMCFAYSISAKFSESIYVGYGYLAIAALIFGNWKILPTLGACLLFGFARSAGYQIVQVLEKPSSCLLYTSRCV